MTTDKEGEIMCAYSKSQYLHSVTQTPASG